jgi:hypothetical protein
MVPVLTAEQALVAARDPHRYLLRVVEREAPLFSPPGWTRLEPARDGAILFIHHERELLAVRVRSSVRL